MITAITLRSSCSIEVGGLGPSTPPGTRWGGVKPGSTRPAMPTATPSTRGPTRRISGARMAAPNSTLKSLMRSSLVKAVTK